MVVFSKSPSGAVLDTVQHRNGAPPPGILTFRAAHRWRFTVSVEAITWALRQDIKPSSTKFVLVVLANCANGNEFLAWPSVAYLIDATSQDRKTVLANLSRLKDAGYIEDTGERRGLTKQVIVYRLKDGSVSDNSTENGTVQTVPNFPSNSTVFPTKQSQNSHETVPKTGHGTVRNHKGTNNPPTPFGKGGCESGDERPKRERKQPVSLKTFADKCKEAGEPVMSGYEPLIRYAEGVGLPMEFVQLAWDVFKAEHSPGGANERRMQSDWRRHFLNYVSKGYYRLWYADALGNFTLTTQGIQAQRLHNQREAA